METTAFDPVLSILLRCNTPFKLKSPV